MREQNAGSVLLGLLLKTFMIVASFCQLHNY